MVSVLESTIKHHTIGARLNVYSIQYMYFVIESSFICVSVLVNDYLELDDIMLYIGWLMNI